MADPPQKGTLAQLGDIPRGMEDVAPPNVAQALRGEPWAYHEACPCGDCMRAYLAAQRPSGGGQRGSGEHMRIVAANCPWLVARDEARRWVA